MVLPILPTLFRRDSRGGYACTLLGSQYQIRMESTSGAVVWVFYRPIKDILKLVYGCPLLCGGDCADESMGLVNFFLASF